jgi:lysophospholipase L1-like esterase
MDALGPAHPDAPAHAVPGVPPCRRRARRLFRWLVAVVLLLAIAAEIFARLGLGLGDPPLSIADPKIEYVFKPGSYHRFHHRVFINDFSMRSPPLTPHKTNPSEQRVLVIGDSIVFGGVQTDDSQLATALLSARLADSLHAPVYIANISAGSWGPPNQLAYLEKFGLFDGDLIVLVLSSHDYADAPTFEPIVGTASFPDRAPISAAWEGFSRYVLHRSSAPPEPGNGILTATADPNAIAACLDSVRKIILMAREHGVPILIAQHRERAEQNAPFEHPGHAAIASIARQLNVPLIELGPAFKRSMDAGQDPYRDPIHPTALGQQILADTLYPAILQKLQKPPASSPSTAATGAQ